MTKIRLFLALLVVVVVGVSTALVAQDDEKATWTVLVYMAADNNLEAFALKDFNEMEQAGSSPGVNVLVQFDRAADYDTSDGDWTDTRRFLVQQDIVPNAINSLELDSLGETNTGDPTYLTDFVLWGIENYPAEHYALVIWDHGGAWLGMATDDSADGDTLTMPELDEALKAVIDTGVIDQLDVIGFDACLMGTLEVYRTVAPYARYAVGSPALVPARGWDYTGLLKALYADPSMDARAFGQTVVDRFFTFYEEEGKVKFYSMALIDLEKAALVDLALREFSDAVVQDPLPAISVIHKARYEAPLLGAEFPASSDTWSTLDLMRFMESVTQNTQAPELVEAAQTVIDAQNLMILDYKRSAYLDNTTGISIYFPRSVRIYRSDPGYDRYRVETPDSLIYWLTFLDTIYQVFVDLGLPEIAIEWGIDAANQALFNFSFNTLGVIQAFFYVLYHMEDSTPPIVVEYQWLPMALSPTAQDSSTTQNVTWAKRIPILTDGDVEVPVLMLQVPQNPGIGAVTGWYTPQDGTPAGMAQVIFDMDTQEAFAVWGAYAGVRALLMPFEIVPEPGDVFEPYWYSLAFNNELVSRMSGTGAVWGQRPIWFFWRELLSGEYEIGVAVESMGGETAQSDVPVTVDENGEVVPPEEAAPPTATPTPVAVAMACVPRTDWPGRHTVQPGETLSGIAAYYGISTEELAEGNCLENPDVIVVGQVLIVPFHNEHPVAIDDYATTNINTTVAIDILVNDYDPDGELNPETVATFDGPGAGSISIDPTNGRVTYSPSTDFYGTDSFLYTVSDMLGAVSNTAVVTITVGAPPAPPTPTPAVTEVPVPTGCVQNLLDGPPGAAPANSLRWCIETTPAGGTVTFDPWLYGTIYLAANHLTLDKNLIIAGTGNITVDANGTAASSADYVRVLTVNSGVTATISNLTMQNGDASWYSMAVGGGIYNMGNLTLSGCTVSGSNGMMGGGGIYNEGVLTLYGTQVSGNNSGTNGGGIANYGTAVMSNSFIMYNTASSNGGGIFEFGTLTIRNSAITYNTAASDGGGIYIGGLMGWTTIVNSTMTYNGTVMGSGGALWSKGAFKISFTTIAYSLSQSDGTQIAAFGSMVDQQIKNSIIYAESTSSCVGGFQDMGGNHSDDDSCVFPATLGPGELGALIDTYHPIDQCSAAAVPGAADCVTIDGETLIMSLNGVIRPAPGGWPCDAGSYENPDGCY